MAVMQPEVLDDYRHPVVSLRPVSKAQEFFGRGLRKWAPPGYSSTTADGSDTLLAQIRAIGVPDGMAGHLVELVRACAAVGSAGSDRAAGSAASVCASAAQDRAKDLLDAVDTLTDTAARMDGVLLEATRQLTVSNGRLLLAEKGIADPHELSPTARDRWRARAKSVSRAEIAAATGRGAGEVSDLVGLAMAPPAVLDPVRAGLSSGLAPWRMVRSFRRACAGLPHEDAAIIAESLFGSDPDTVATERITSTGELIGAPWQHRDFYRALDREVALHTTDTPAKARRTKRRILDAGDVQVTADGDGTARVTITCSMTQAAAIHDRIDTGARLIRKAGDPRPLHQIRTAITAALLLHGTIRRDDDQSADVGTTLRSEQMDRVMAGLPAATINVIVPMDTLAPQSSGPHTRSERPPVASVGENSACYRPEPPGGDPPPPGSGVAEVTGTHPHFLTGAQVRELALQPGSAMYRLLTDPVSGRCLERTTDAYRFDKAMRDQIAAADLICRAPGCHAPARACEFDHVQEYGTPAGVTAEANGALLHGHHHQRKTDKAWDAVLNARRDLTWTTLLGRVYVTKAHDYRQYTRLLNDATSRLRDTAVMDHTPDSDAVDDVVYAALTLREAGRPLHLAEDVDEPVAYPSWDSITLTHTTSNGDLRYEPDPEITEAELRRQHGDSLRDALRDRAQAKAVAPWLRTVEDPPPF